MRELAVTLIILLIMSGVWWMMERRYQKKSPQERQLAILTSVERSKRSVYLSLLLVFLAYLLLTGLVYLDEGGLTATTRLWVGGFFLLFTPTVFGLIKIKKGKSEEERQRGEVRD